MLPDLVSNPGPLTYESGALPTVLRGPALSECNRVNNLTSYCSYAQPSLIQSGLLGPFQSVPVNVLPKWSSMKNRE